MTDAEKLRQLADQVDELRRMQTTYRRPLNRPDAEAMKKQEAKVDALTAQYRTADVPANAAELPTAT